jgi:fructokinase
MNRIAGLELGGTKCVVVLANADGQIIAQNTIPTLDPTQTFGVIEHVLESWWEEEPFNALGIASFGPIGLDPLQPTYGTITTTAKPGWRDTPVASRLAAKFPVPIAFDTDVNGAAFAERRWGAGQGIDDFAYVTVGTGVGVGLIVNGRATRGLGHCEAGHIRVPRLPEDDWVGHCPYHGDCVEGLVAGPAIQARTGYDARTLADDDQVWDGVVNTLAGMAQALVSIAGPRRILFGGGVIASRPILIERIEQRLRDLTGSYLALPERDFIMPPALGALAGPLGPIALALDARTQAEKGHAN